MNTLLKSKGFTLIETLVAISILLVAVAGPLVVVSQALTSSYYARDQITAFYLAQDAIEYLRNEKDLGIKDNGEAFDSDEFGSCASVCEIDTVNSKVRPGTNPEPLGYENGVYSFDGDASRFFRTIKITPRDLNGSDEVQTMDEYKVDVTVSWKTNLTGETTRSIVLTEYLYAVIAP